MITAKNMAIATAFALCLVVLYNTDKKIGARPINIKDCDTDQEYLLRRDSFGTDREIKPGQFVTMLTKFTNIADTKQEITHFQIDVYKGIKIFSMTKKKTEDFSPSEQTEFDFGLSLPSLIPHINVQLKISFKDSSEKVLNCVAFDLHL